MEVAMTIDDAAAIKQVDVQSQVSIAVARKAMDTQKQQGDAAIALLQAAAETAQSTNAYGGRMDLKA